MAAVTGRDSIVKYDTQVIQRHSLDREGARGERGNAMVDNLVFDGAPTKPVKKNFESFS